MDARLTPVYEVFKLNTRYFLNTLDAMNDDQASWRPGDATNGAAYIALHLVDSRFWWAGVIGLKLENPFAAIAKNARGIADVKHLPALDELRASWKLLTGEIRARFDTLTADDLNRDTGTKLPIDDKSVLGVLAFNMHHEAYHIGQLGLLRKQVGLPAMALR